MKREHLALAASIAVLMLSPVIVMRSGMLDHTGGPQPAAPQPAPQETARNQDTAGGSRVDRADSQGEAAAKKQLGKVVVGKIDVGQQSTFDTTLGSAASTPSVEGLAAGRTVEIPIYADRQSTFDTTLGWGVPPATLSAEESAADRAAAAPAAPKNESFGGKAEPGPGSRVRALLLEAPQSVEAQGAYGKARVKTEEARSQAVESGRDRFDAKPANTFKLTQEEPVSTFSVDVDTASYSFMRGALAQNALPQQAAVRTEELINYFPYDYPLPDSADEPFRVTTSVFPSPWSEGRKIMHVGIKGYAVQPSERPRANIVLLVDVSGSMSEPNKLPLLQKSLAMMTEALDARDTVAIVTYAGQAGIALEPTPVAEKQKILNAIERLSSGGSTAGAAGIRGAYALAEQNYDPKGVNRILLATDGDFNVGITNHEELKSYIARKRETGIFLSVLGFGRGNYNDALMQTLAQNGNGVAAYIDTLNEARKVLVEEATSSLIPIAKDVKIQVEFNPATVSEYRLIGYETRLLRREDFNNDKVDAGDVGSGHTVTALYEFAPAGGPSTTDPLRYRQVQSAPGSTDEYAFVKLRYKLPKSDTSRLITMPVDNKASFDKLENAPQEARFATAVAAFGEILRGAQHTGRFTYDDVLRLASTARGEDLFGYRSEFLQLVRAAKTAH